MTTVQLQGWAGTSNGELLRLAAADFDVPVTGDTSLQDQQDLSGVQLGLIVLAAPDNRVETITSMAPQVLEALARVGSGEVVRVAV